MKKLSTLFVSLAYMAAAIAGYIFAITPLANIFAFATGVLVVLMTIQALSGVNQDRLLQTYVNGEHLPRWFDMLVYTICIIASASAAHFWVASGVCIIGSIDLYFRETSKTLPPST